MDEKKDDPIGLESMMNLWTNSMSNLMSGMAGMAQQPFPFQSPPSPFPPPFSDINALFQNSPPSPFPWTVPWGQSTSDASSDKTKHSTDTDQNTQKKEGPFQETMDNMSTAMKNWQILSSAMTSPSSVSALFKGLGTLPEILSDFAGSSMTGLSEIHQKMIESISRMGESVEAYKYDKMDSTVFNLWGELYEKEFRKFLRIPQLGLTREYQEKFNDMVDKYNIHQTQLADFMRLLSLPFQHSAKVMQEEVQALAEKGALSEDPKVYYQMWIKILEGHFMKLFQTQEYIEGLSKTISTMSRYTKAKSEVLENILSPLPVAKQSELDDLAKEFNQLKRELRALKKRTHSGGDK